MKQYTEDMDQKLTGNKGPLVYAGIKSIVKSSLGKNVLTLISYITVYLQNKALTTLFLKQRLQKYMKCINLCFNIYCKYRNVSEQFILQ